MNRLACLGALAASAILATTNARADDNGGATTVQTDANANANAANTTNANANASTSNTARITDVLEEKGQSYYFLGANYRVGLVPAFIINLFVDAGPTGVLGESTVGLSFDYRKDHFSIIPGINYSSYNMDPSIFIEKNKTGLGNTTVVAANLNAIYLTMDLLWSVPIAKAGQVDFEFGFAVGFGGIWGDLYNTWVSSSNTGGASFKGQDGTVYYQCVTTGPVGCNASDHSNSTVNKVGATPGKGYREPMWFDSGGGSVPNILPWIELPILGFRFKPIKEFEARFNTGFSLTGFFFNFSAYYGFENPKSSPK